LENRDLYCPTHKVKLVLRVAKQGKAIGKKFWGCPTWSKTKCNYTIPFEIKKKVEPTFKEKFFKQIKNKNGKISPLKVLGYVLMIPFYILYFIVKSMNDVLPTRKRL